MRPYAEFFRLATGTDPYPYQCRIAESDGWPTIARIPTGLGKTAATIVAWLWHLLERGSAPRRLVYVLPLRSLVEQTADAIACWLERLGAAAYDVPDVCKLLGGDVPREWIGRPQDRLILVGTQDLLLSRALNRGYAMGRRSWPMAFALLNNDCLWIVDEVQLQGIGATTAAQLQGFREAADFGAFGPTAALFVSATIDRRWIDTYDHPLDGRTSIELGPEDLAISRVAAILSASKHLMRTPHYDPNALADLVIQEHRPVTRTLIVVNQVARAVQVYQRLRRQESSARIVLLHSQFRAHERMTHLETALAEPADAGVIVVATQVVEAGLDFSSDLLISDLAPWASMVQRFGRCNRYGNVPDARVLWCEPPTLDAKSAVPYQRAELEMARECLVSLEGKSVAAAKLPTVDDIPQPRGATLRKSFLLDLLDTSPDLSGADLDVSPFIRPFIRPDDQFTVSVLWRDEPPTTKLPPRRDELCPAPRDAVQKLIAERRRDRSDAMVVDQQSRRGAWIPAPRQLKIGEIVWLRRSVGGYTEDTGFDPRSTEPVEAVSINEIDAADRDDDTVDGDARSMDKAAVTLEVHASDTARAAESLVNELESIIPSNTFRRAIVTAARWHDVGKVHNVFQNTMRRAGCADNGAPWAKAPGRAQHERKQFRHELVSALGWLASRPDDPDRDFVAYLIAAHHGVVRLSAYHIAAEDETPAITILGVQQGDKVQAAALGSGEASIAFTADLSLFKVGGAVVDGTVQPSWTDRVLELYRNLGPFRLTFLETLVRAADWAASAKPSETVR